MSIHEKLNRIQTKLVAPKNQRNNFGNYNYRSCEDILEGVKPLLAEEKLTLILKDEIEKVDARYYVKATAILTDAETQETIENTSFAREEENKKGMDSSQVTGATSSYARKYALNGLFAIDDTKDADTDAHTKTTTPAPSKPSQSSTPAKPPQQKTAPKTPPKTTVDDSLKNAISKIDGLAREKVAINKDAVIEAVSKNNGGSSDYKKVKTVEDANKIIVALEAIKSEG